jgi:hypothetical protein
MSASRASVSVDDAFHAALITLFVALTSTAALSRDLPPLPDSPVVSLSASVHGARSLPDI